jgi:hypothetical protein
MLDDFRQRLRDRRGQYSLRRHVARLKREGRLSRIGAGTLAAVIAAGVAFAQCQSSSITGPSEEVTESNVPGAPAGGSVSLSGGSSNDNDSDTDGDSDSEDSDSDKLVPGLDSDSDGDSDSDNVPILDPPPLEFEEKTFQRDVVFTGANPCNGETYEARGTRRDHVKSTIASDYFESRHRFQDKFQGFAVIDLPPRPTRYKGEDEHDHHIKVVFAEGSDDELETEEELVAVGPEPDWTLKYHERRKIDMANPMNSRYEVRARGRCKGTCTLPGGCPDVDFKLSSFQEIEVPPLP